MIKLFDFKRQLFVQPQRMTIDRTC